MFTTVETENDTAAHWSETDIKMMMRAFNLARQGAGQTSSGPLVGCVIVDSGGQIVGEGFYTYDGLEHAETFALWQAGDRACGATAYISLEPHAHQSRTQPCTKRLIDAGIKRVVAPIEDPNPLVSGRGFEQLRAAGIEVSVGLLSREARRINEGYLHFIRCL